MEKNQKGFSLIELLIVVVIVGVICAIAIPNLLAARRSANEGSAISTLRTVHSGQYMYQATAGNGNYGTFQNLAGRQILDQSFNVDNPIKSGYRFYMNDFPAAGGTTPNPATFSVVARPTSTAVGTATGTRNFGIETAGILAAQVVGSGTTFAPGGDKDKGATYGSAGAVMGN